MLKNKYWVLRHGRSIPNEQGVIVSHKSNGTLPQYGLAPEGFVQAAASGELFSKELKDAGLSAVAIYSSPFTRTKETAGCVADVLGLAFGNVVEIQELDELRERYFGPPLELQSHLHYPEIWEIDVRDPLVGPEGGESVADVARRVANVIPHIESQIEGHAVLLVSHGDTLQILQTATRAPCDYASDNASILSQHRQYSLVTGELRRLV